MPMSSISLGFVIICMVLPPTVYAGGRDGSDAYAGYAVAGGAYPHSYPGSHGYSHGWGYGKVRPDLYRCSQGVLNYAPYVYYGPRRPPYYQPYAYYPRPYLASTPATGYLPGTAPSTYSTATSVSPYTEETYRPFYTYPRDYARYGYYSYPSYRTFAYPYEGTPADAVTAPIRPE